MNMTKLALLFATNPFFAQVDYSSSTSGQAPGPLFWMIELLFIVVMIAAMWKIFTKANQPGWASIIPIYNWIVWCNIVGRPWWWIFLLLICFPIFYIILCIDLAKSFGQGVAFAIGMIFLPFIFFLILGFGGATYQGPSALPTTAPAV